MKKILLAAALLIAGTAGAQKYELGARVGLASQNMSIKLTGIDDVKSQLGWHLAAVGRLRIVGLGSGLLGAGLYLQPEVVYSQSSLKFKASSGDTKINMSTVDIPILLSAKVSIARVHAGPVFNLMNNFSSSSGKLEMKTNRSAVGYVVGAGVKFLGLEWDARYHGEFKKLKSNIDGGGTLSQSVENSLSSWSIGVGLMF